MTSKKGGACPKGCIDKYFSDISKTDALTHIAVGTSTGLITGMLAVKSGKGIALVTATGIVLLQIAYDAGYIKVNWNRIGKQLDKISDKVEEKATGSGPNWLDKVDRFIDKKMDDVEAKCAEGQKKTKRWYCNLVGEDNYKIKITQIFLISFAGGVALGIAAS